MEELHSGERSSLGERTRHWLGWQAVTGASVLALMTFVGAAKPRFFFADDKQSQYVPVAQDIGRRLRHGEWLPVVDPDLGRGGNYALDLQYGLFEPTHWVSAVALSFLDNRVLGAWLWAAAYLMILAAGICALLLRLKVPGSWASATAVGVTLSGYVLFWAAASWVPALVSLAWVPWWWWSAVAPRLRAMSLIATGVLTFLVLGGGWPATWVIWGLLVAGVVIEGVVRRAEPCVVRAALLRVLASAGGGVAALITGLPLQRAFDFTSRSTELSNRGALVPNLADVLGFASPSLAGELNTFGGPIEHAPLFFGMWFVVVVAWLVPWSRSVLMRPAAVTSLFGLLSVLLLTQAPSHLGPLRWPVRFVPGVPLFLGVGIAVALAAGGLRLTRGRIVGALLTVLASCLLTIFRLPTSTESFIGALLLLGSATVLLVALAAWGGRLAGLTALLTTLMMAAWMVAAHASEGMGDWRTPTSVTTGDLRLDQRPALTLFPRTGAPKGWFPQGVAIGFLRLTEDQRTQPGYSSIGQKGWDDGFCVNTAHGFTCPEAVSRLFEVEPRTGMRWVDLLGYQEVVLHDGPQLARWRAATQGLGAWRESGRTQEFVRFSRTEPLEPVGRVSALLGDATVEAVDVENSRQTYSVDSADGATLVFRDLYWPGYVATLDGEPLHVEPLDGTLVTVELPPGSRGTLEVSYVPLPTAIWATLAGVAVLLVALAVLLSRSGRSLSRRVGRQRSASPGS